MLSSSSYSPASRGPSGPIIGSIPLRLASAVVLLYLHAWNETPLGYQSLWNGKPWHMIDLVTAAGLPMAKAVAITGGVVLVLVIASWLLGFLTRLFSIVFLPVTLGALYVCNKNADIPGAELCILYSFIALTILVTGPGWFSIDAIYGLRRNRKKVTRY